MFWLNQTHMNKIIKVFRIYRKLYVSLINVGAKLQEIGPLGQSWEPLMFTLHRYYSCHFELLFHQMALRPIMNVEQAVKESVWQNELMVVDKDQNKWTEVRWKKYHTTISYKNYITLKLLWQFAVLGWWPLACFFLMFILICLHY